MSNSYSKNSASTPIASTSSAMVSTDNENTIIMGPPKTTSSAMDLVKVFVEDLIKDLARIPDAIDRNPVRTNLAKFISDRVTDVITSEELESDSDPSSDTDSDSSRRPLPQPTTLDAKLNENFTKNIIDLLQGIDLDKQFDVIKRTTCYMDRLLRKRRINTEKKRKRPSQTTEKILEEERGSAAKKNAIVELVNKWLEACEQV